MAKDAPNLQQKNQKQTLKISGCLAPYTAWPYPAYSIVKERTIYTLA